MIINTTNGIKNCTQPNRFTGSVGYRLAEKSGFPRTLAIIENKALKNLNERSEERFLGKRSNRPNDEADK